MSSRQPKPGSAMRASRQRLLKPLDSVHGLSPLRLKMSVDDLERLDPKKSSRPRRNSSRAMLSGTSSREAALNSVDSPELHHDKENVNPHGSPTRLARARARDVKEPLAEITLLDADESVIGDDALSDKDYTLDSDFHTNSEHDSLHFDLQTDSESELPIEQKPQKSPKRIKPQGNQTIKVAGGLESSFLKDQMKIYEEQDLGLEKALKTLTLEDLPRLSANQGEESIGVRAHGGVTTEQVPATPRKKSFGSEGALPSPSKSRLNSPLKSPRKENQERLIPPTPHRPSIDAFWSQETVNLWNDEHSPKKVIGSPRKGALQRMLEEVEGWSENDTDNDDEKQNQTTRTNSVYASHDKTRSNPTNSQAPAKSPSKKQLTQQAREVKAAAKAAKDEFLNSREALAASFLNELDDQVAGGRITELTKESGGVKILWSATLRSTAGRANWRREAIRRTHDLPLEAGNRSPEAASSGKMLVRPCSGTTGPVVLEHRSVPTVQYRHVANIELATKVITSKDRLLNVIAHEFCHLANFMISNVKDQPHGKSFKGWASKVTLQFQDRGVHVTTKHDWEVEYKYEWVCVGRIDVKARQHGADADIESLMHQLAMDRAELTMDEDGCGTLYQRHSKSIDPGKHRCGKCKGTLLQTKPAPRRKREN